MVYLEIKIVKVNGAKGTHLSNARLGLAASKVGGRTKKILYLTLMIFKKLGLEIN